MNILRIEDVVKTYDKHIAVNHVSFDMPEGCIFGMLGPNGAGKSSLIRMITTITRPDSGKIFFANEPLNSGHPEQIGYMPEERGLYKKMKIGDHMLYLAQLKGLSYNDARTEVKKWFIKLDITSWWDKKSGGTLQRDAAKSPICFHRYPQTAFVDSRRAVFRSRPIECGLVEKRNL